ncbi:MAG TPA: hypothetical protein VGO34_01735 [Alphaproteobacteria bacterium]|jgi:uncharacterized membrane protein YraQ (UPF0718 family)
MKEPRAKKKSGSILSRMFDQTFWLFFGMMLVAGAACWYLRGSDAFFGAFHEDLNVLLGILPRIVLAMIMSGFAQVLLPREQVAYWVGGHSGWRGLFIATAAGALTPGGPMASFPFVVALYMAGADRGALVAYLTSWALLGFQRVTMWEIPLMGMDFAILRSIANLPLPLIAGYIARQLPGLPARVETLDDVELKVEGEVGEAPIAKVAQDAAIRAVGKEGLRDAPPDDDASGEGSGRRG